MQPQTKQRLRKQNGAIAQLVEQRTENPCVPGSIPGGTTTKCSVRITVSTQDSQSCNRGSIPLPSTKFYKNFGRIPEWPNGADCKSAGFYLRWFESIFSHYNYAEVAQLVEHNLAKVGVASSSLVFRSKGSRFCGPFFVYTNCAPPWHNAYISLLPKPSKKCVYGSDHFHSNLPQRRQLHVRRQSEVGRIA